MTTACHTLHRMSLLSGQSFHSESDSCHGHSRKDESARSHTGCTAPGGMAECRDVGTRCVPPRSFVSSRMAGRTSEE